jgi:sugar lactone lactonase YvrE
MRPSLLAVTLLALGGCVSPEYGAQPFRCSGGRCPEGYACVEGRCCRDDGVDDPANPCRLCQPGLPCVRTVAGSGAGGFSDGPAGTAQLRGPTGVAADGTTVYFSEAANHAIRVLRQGKVERLAGGQNGFADGPVASARFDRPVGLAVGPDGALYVADSHNSRIRRIAKGVVSTVAGSGTFGNADGPVDEAQFRYPQALAVDAAGRIYVADTWAYRIRVISSGKVTTLAGSTSGYVDGPVGAARFVEPKGIAVDDAGRVIVSDRNRVRVIHNGTVTTLAGGGAGFADGAAAAASFDKATGLAPGADGTLYIADGGNHRIRTLSGGQVRTLAGQSTVGSADGPGALATFDRPSAVALAGDGRLYVADSYNNKLRAITLP